VTGGQMGRHRPTGRQYGQPVRSPAPADEGQPSGPRGGRHAAPDEDDETRIVAPRQRTDESAAVISRIGADRPSRIIATRIEPDEPSIPGPPAKVRRLGPDI